MEVNTVCEILTLCYTLAELDAERLIYALADRQSVVEKEKVGNTLAKVKCKVVLDTLAAREREVKVHILGDTLCELKGMETLDTLQRMKSSHLATHKLK